MDEDNSLTTSTPQVAIVMGSRSDWSTLAEAAEVLQQLGVDHHIEVVSAHRTPQKMFDFAQGAVARGLRVIIAGAGGAAHLPGMIAAMTPLPVLGVPVKSAALSGMDSLLSIVQMPRGVAVGTLAIGSAGAFNAGLLAAQILAAGDAGLRARIQAWREARSAEVLAHPDPREDAT
jgi:5-(carboxyamino)imidazole ribonucleotide mutase